MHKVILIHAHDNLELLNRLVDTIASENHSIYVNVDLKADLDLTKISSKVRLIRNRIKIQWGGFSQVLAVLNSLREIEKNENNYEHVIFISGQHFPIVANNVIDERLLSGNEYICVRPIDGTARVADRYEKFHFGLGTINVILSSLVNALVKKGPLPNGYVPYWGSQWWVLSQECIQYILDFTERDSSFLNYFRFSMCCDEIFFQTIIMNSKFKQRIVNNNFLYLDWTDCSKGLTSSPNVLSPKDFNKIIQSESLFCRKVACPQSNPLLEMLLDNITQTESQFSMDFFASEIKPTPKKNTDFSA